jgi:hypothetical protein
MFFRRFFTNTNNDKKNYYLGIVLKEKNGEIWILEENNLFLNLNIKRNFSYSNGFENITEDIDSILTTIEEEKSFLRDIKNTIFFLSGFFVDDTGLIKKIYLAKLKDLVKNLELKPLGYIEILPALVEQLEKEEGLPLSLISLEIEKTSFKFLLKKAGKIIFEKEFPKTDDFIVDFYEALNKVKDHAPLPIRIVVYDDDLKKEKELLLNHGFKEDYFIQPPRIEIPDKEKIEKMLIKSLSEQLILNQAPSLTIQSAEEKKVEKKEIMGFTIGADVSENKSEAFSDNQIEKNIFSFKQLGNLINIPLIFLKKIKLLSVQLISRLTIKRLKFSALFLIGAFVILLGFFVDEYFFHKADITLYLPTKEIKDQIELNTSLEKLNQLETTPKIEETISVTGEKTIGEKARGEVNIYNYTFAEKNFNAGTTLEFNGLNYILEEGVKVASASQIGEMRQPGKTKTSISATFVGEEGNMKKGTVFKIGDLSVDNFFAKNDSDLFGGLKKKVKFFSLEDKERLEGLVKQSLEKEALAYYEDKKKKDNNNFFIKDLIKIEIKKRDIAKEVGEEADKVNEIVEANITYYYLGKENLLKEIVANLKSKLPEGYVVNNANIKFDLTQIKKNDNNIKLVFNYHGYGVKKIDHDKIRKSLVFLPEKNLKKILKDQYQIGSVNFINKKKIPLLKGRLPIFINNIKLVEEML